MDHVWILICMGGGRKRGDKVGEKKRTGVFLEAFFDAGKNGGRERRSSLTG